MKHPWWRGAFHSFRNLFATRELFSVSSEIGFAMNSQVLENAELVLQGEMSDVPSVQGDDIESLEVSMDRGQNLNTYC
ncbi:MULTISPECIES: hypothetical protein [unclassified Streptomyces]